MVRTHSPVQVFLQYKKTYIYVYAYVYVKYIRSYIPFSEDFFGMKFGVKKRRLDGHGVPPGEDAVPHDAVFTGRMAGRQQDPHQPVAEEEQRDRRSDTTPSHATGGRNEESLSP